MEDLTIWAQTGGGTEVTNWWFFNKMNTFFGNRTLFYQIEYLFDRIYYLFFYAGSFLVWNFTVTRSQRFLLPSIKAPKTRTFFNQQNSRPFPTRKRTTSLSRTKPYRGASLPYLLPISRPEPGYMRQRRGRNWSTEYVKAPRIFFGEHRSRFTLPCVLFTGLIF